MNDREIVVGISGGIAAYKTAMLVSRLVQSGAGVTVVMTKAAERFVGSATFAALSGRNVAKDAFDEQHFPLGPHISLAERGDLLPQKAIESLLEQIGKEVPKVAQPELPPEVATGDGIIDRRSGRAGSRMPDPPMRGPVGQFIYDHYTQETWREWIGQGTKVINELRLDFSNPQHRETFDEQMMEWLGISDQDVADYAKESETKP